MDPSLSSPASSSSRQAGDSGELERANQACRQCRAQPLEEEMHQRTAQVLIECLRLGKRCMYPSGRRPYGSGSGPGNQDSPLSEDHRSTLSTNSANSSVSSQHLSFPDAFFLDNDLFRPVPHASLAAAAAIPVHVTHFLSPGPDSICDSYFSTIDTWFPFVSRKRLEQALRGGGSESESPGVNLLLLCMRLITDNPLLSDVPPSESVFYRPARAYLNTVEETAPASLPVFQALVLITLYELGHGIFPQAYLTVARAARIGVLRGVHDRKNTTQLLVTPPTYTVWEEERRTWWATSILERHLNLGPTGLPHAVPDPAQGELLPSLDDEWRNGGMRANNPLFTNSLAANHQLGPFARACQASHVLSRVLQHRTYSKDASADRDFVLSQALQLVSTLSALDQHLAWSMDHQHQHQHQQEQQPGVTTVDVAICTSARLALYHVYACHAPGAEARKFAEETALQQASFDGVEHVVSVRGLALARCVIAECSDDVNRASPLVAQALYDAATECQWFIREGGARQGAASVTLELLFQALGLMAQRWTVASKCLKLLRQAQE